MTSSTSARWSARLFGATIFAAAFLIFLVQPMVGKRILPWFGGAPAVWTLCLAFYQSALFVGYLYSHLLIRWVPPTRQLPVHALAVAAAWLALPALPPRGWRPDPGADPVVLITGLLLTHVALPFLVLASTAPLLQAWFAQRFPERSPYPLYAVSNAGSLLALLAYPLWVEPRIALSTSGTAWSVAFVVTGACVLLCAALTRERRPAPSRQRAEASPASARETPLPSALHPPTAITWGLGCALSMTAVILLMGVTNELCRDVASVPFLWVLPLAGYLVTFILCFAGEKFYRRSVVYGLLAVTTLLTLGAGLWEPRLPPAAQQITTSLPFQIPAYVALLFAGCMAMHGELYRLRPPGPWLTSFYLCISGGGALGGLFTGLVAPRIFSDYFEFELALALVLLLALAACAADRESLLGVRAPGWRWAVVGCGSAALLGILGWETLRESTALQHRERNFFGVIKVLEFEGSGGGQRQLFHGTTLHGIQFLAKQARQRPTSYYGRATGIGLLLDSRERRDETRIGVVGLGVGTLAAYGRSEDRFRFYEIDPAIVRIARSSGDFRFLRDSAARIEVVTGDARLALADELARSGPPDFDLLVVDAFSGDAIPVHLLTREAFQLYAASLATEGILAIHVSSRYFHLFGFAARMGLDAGLQNLQVFTQAVPERNSTKAGWVFLARDRERLLDIDRRMKARHRRLRLPPDAIATHQATLDELADVPVWTDDYSDLLSLLR